MVHIHVVSCHIVANVEIGWHATLLTNGSNMDMVKMSVVDKSLKCGNYPKNNVLPFVGPRQSSAHKCVRKIAAHRWRPPNLASCWKCWKGLACEIVGKWLKNGHGENLEIGWHVRLLTNRWNMEITKETFSHCSRKQSHDQDCWHKLHSFPCPARQDRCSAHPNSSCQPLHAHDVGAVWFLPPKPQTVLAKTYFHPSPIDERSLIVNMSTCDHVVCNKPWLD